MSLLYYGLFLWARICKPPGIPICLICNLFLVLIRKFELAKTGRETGRRQMEKNEQEERKTTVFPQEEKTGPSARVDSPQPPFRKRWFIPVISEEPYLPSDLREQICGAGRKSRHNLFAYQFCDYCQPLGDLFVIPPSHFMNISALFPPICHGSLLLSLLMSAASLRSV